MSDDPNEFRVINVYGDDPIPKWVDAEGSAVTEFPASENLTKHRIEEADFKAWLTDQMGFPDRLYFWTSSRGDHWEKIEAYSAESAAIMQAERWSQKGHRGPFAIMVSVSGLEQPPRDGDRVWVFDVNPDILFRATHQGFYCFKSPSK